MKGKKPKSRKPPPKGAIVIVHYNGTGLIRGCLSSLRKTDYPQMRVFVFDNGSTDDSKEIIAKEFPEAVVFSAKDNLGLTRAANRAFMLAMGGYPCDYIVFMNNDIEIISPGWLSKLVALAEKSDDAGIVGCKLLYPDNTIQHAGEIFWPDRLRGKGEPADRYGMVEELEAVTFATVLISRRLLERTGLLDEVFSPFYYEDVDLCFRARRAGFRILYSGGVSLYHLEGGSMKMDLRREYAIARNAIIFYARYASLPQLIAMAARIYARLIIRRADKRRDFGKGNMSVLMSPGDIISLPYRVLLMTAAIFNGLRLHRTNRIPQLPPSKPTG